MGVSTTTSRKLPLLCFTFLCGLSGIWAKIVAPQSKIEAIKGQYVELRASYTGSDPNTNTIIWNFGVGSTQLEQVISYSTNVVNEVSERFKGRVGFLNKMPSQDVSIYINNTQESDSGSFACQVINPGLIALFTLDVKVPPSTPKCFLSGKPVPKGNVTLNCVSSSGKPVPVYKWKKTSPTSEVFFSPMLNEKTGILKLNNLSSNMSGIYECTANNSAGFQTCVIALEIATSSKAGVIVGATIGSVAAFIFLLLLCLAFVFMKRRRDNEDDMANEIKEDAQAPKRVSWAKSGMGSDIISKNGTLSSIASTPTHYSYNNNTTLPREQPLLSDGGSNGGSVPRPERYTQLPQAQAVPQTYSHPQLQLQTAPSPPPLPTSTIMASNITRMGGVPIMVPAQNQAGSLV
ncbi:endothelial cell adhesion molecule a isoform X2 [Archocentrus centrarchus]|uniref:endothelial cell adhesion molecule a isoform X2 n=1 Tax=Archocentrus centrarchus TaxID=63155 RepID=UPI0011E9FBA7|nr:endothelial cell-selective adhesion molecule-like isoform X2 [Archocentrus centrarchus]